MEDSVNKLLIKEHARLLSYLVSMGNESDEEKLKEIYDKFKWNLEKHFFVEEKAIFDFYDKIKGHEVGNVFDLMQEHGDLLNLVKSVEEDFSHEKIEDLKNLLIKHQRFEDEVFYPNLDKELDDYKKKELIEKIKEVIRV
ncbi:MAG: hemerythrin domain-containing protein [Candidatus Pacearchaeota archaeon]|nr:hemerythrin domain-containing protein [Candidatus Pacearchaeota archaeon]